MFNYAAKSNQSVSLEVVREVHPKRLPYTAPLIIQFTLTQIKGGINHLQESDGLGFTS